MRPLATTKSLSYNPLGMAEAQQNGRNIKRPFGVTLVSWGVFLLGLANLWRATALYRQSDLLLELGVSLDPRFRFILALFWAIAFILAAFALWRKWTVARFITPVLLLLFSVSELGLTFWFARSANSRDSLSIGAVLYVILILFSVWALNRKAARRYFEIEEEDDRFEH